jgi:hypothetical protein
MDEDLKKDLKKLGRGAEKKLALSLLRWKYKREGRTAVEDRRLEDHSRIVADRAHEVVARAGKGVWKELSKAYRKDRKGRKEKESSGE